jgi:hypothetical protein
LSAVVAPYPTRLPAQVYPDHNLLFIASSLTAYHINLEETDDGI